MSRALADHHLPLDPLLVLPGDFQYASGIRAVQTWGDERHYRPCRDIEAIVVANDYMAIGVLMELQTRGIRVPDDIAVTGFDDIALDKTFTPPLTTVRQPFEEIGRCWEQPAEAIKQAVVDDVFAHIGAHIMYDDVTLVVLKQQ